MVEPKYGSLLLTLMLALSPACGTDGGESDGDAGGRDGGDEGTIRDGDAGEAADIEQQCEPGSRVCATARSYLECGADGETRTQVQCDASLGCLEGECVETICTPFEVAACANVSQLEMCNFSGTEWTLQDCPEFYPCEGSRCVEPPCLPGATRCDGLDVILTCDPATGEFTPQAICEPGEACFEDRCQPLCQISEKLRSYVGCEYYSVDLDNYSDAETIEHTVVLANASDDVDAVVEVVDNQGFSLPLASNVVPRSGQLVIRFPAERGLIRPGVTNFSWRITASVPVTAHQFNPLDNFTDPFTNDGTLLLPVHGLGDRYYALSWIHRNINDAPLNGFITIVAVEPDGAEVRVEVAAGAEVGDGAAPMIAGEARTWTLEQGQTLTLQTAGAGDDLTGSFIESLDGGEIAVFGGHECGNVLLGVDRCDHMEAQLLPIELLRGEYLATKYQPRVIDPELRVEPDYWRVLAVDGATRITTDPEIPGADGAILGRGEWLQIEYRSDFVISADRPVAVGHYMVGANSTGIPRNCFDNSGAPTGIGDPAMTQLIPIEQFRSDYLVLTPFAYVEDYLNLAVPTTAIGSVRIDNAPVEAEAFTPIATSTWSAARVRVADGPHQVVADTPFGLDAYGYSCHVSYAYPGGLALEVLGEQ